MCFKKKKKLDCMAMEKHCFFFLVRKLELNKKRSTISAIAVIAVFIYLLLHLPN